MDDDSIYTEKKRLSQLEGEFAIAALMGNIQVEGGSVAGHRASAIAASVEKQKLREKRQKEDLATILIVEALRKALQEIDARIEILNTEIDELEDDLQEAKNSSKKAFDKMHELESQVEEIEDHGFTDNRREALRQNTQAHATLDDKALLERARSQITEQQQIGIDDHISAEIIEAQLSQKIQIRDDLIKARNEINKHPTASIEEKTVLAKAALEHSVTQENIISEGSQLVANQALDQTEDAQRKELSKDDNFDFDENLSIESELKLIEPKF